VEQHPVSIQESAVLAVDQGAIEANGARAKGGISRFLTQLSWTIVIAGYPVIVFAFVYPSAFSNGDSVHVWVAWTAVMVRTFLFHAGLGLGLLGVVAGLGRKWWLVAAIVPLVAFTLAPAAMSYVPRQTPAVAGETVRVMSLNLMGSNRQTGAVLEEIRSEDPDILLLQEFNTRWAAALLPELSEEYPHVQYGSTRGLRGQAVFSRLPVEGMAERLQIGSGVFPQFRTIVELSGKRVAVYNVHLITPSLPPRAVYKRQQFAELLEVIAAEELPFILAGDLNAASGTPYMDALRGLGLVEVHAVAGRGRGATWPARGRLSRLPGIRIDHVFLSSELTCTAARTGARVGSDHRAVITEIGFKAVGSERPE
jgi:endonuclease/exonuclease/phosphatase (EEP) superfamily protein YafD